MLRIQNLPINLSIGTITKVLAQAAFLGTTAAAGWAAFSNPASLLSYGPSLGLSTTQSLMIIDALPWIAATSLAVYGHSMTSRNGSIYSTLLSSTVTATSLLIISSAARTISPGQQQEIEELHTNYEENATTEMLQSNMPYITNRLPGIITSALVGAVYMFSNAITNFAHNIFGRNDGFPQQPNPQVAQLQAQLAQLQAQLGQTHRRGRERTPTRSITDSVHSGHGSHGDDRPARGGSGTTPGTGGSIASRIGARRRSGAGVGFADVARNMRDSAWESEEAELSPMRTAAGALPRIPPKTPGRLQPTANGSFKSPSGAEHVPMVGAGGEPMVGYIKPGGGGRVLRGTTALMSLATAAAAAAKKAPDQHARRRGRLSEAEKLGR
jgi:hypothetical protein